MKKVLALDLGTNSVGFALVNEAETKSEKSDIIKMGSRIIVADPDFHAKFNEGKPASKNSFRRQKRGTRRLNQRFKLRRDNLINILTNAKLLPINGEINQLNTIELYGLRAKAVNEKIELFELGRVLFHINQKRGYKSNRKANQNEDENVGEYLENIKKLEGLVKDITVGEYLFNIIKDNNIEKLRGRVFTRAAYEREFNKIWDTQRKFYPEILTGDINNNKPSTLFHKIYTTTIFYQRRLKSAKHLVSNCRYEKHHKCAPKSSPIFQEFRIWQEINNLVISKEGYPGVKLDLEQKHLVYGILNNPEKLNGKGEIPASKILKEILGKTQKGDTLNFEKLEGNKTLFVIYKAMKEAEIDNKKLLTFNPFEVNSKNDLFHLWHLIYSTEEDDKLVNNLIKPNSFGLNIDQANLIVSKVGFTSDYGSLSSRAIKKLLPHLQNGLDYSEACMAVGYAHSDTLTNEENEKRELVDSIPLIKSNELRNPVVEQIMNQTINIVNQIIQLYGKPDEIRVELARELKNNAKKRAKMTSDNRQKESENKAIIEKLKNEGFKNPSKNDIERYKLWEETDRICLYSGKTISLSKLYNGETDIEHIIPKSRAFDDSLNNKIIVYKKENQAKNQMTAFDFMKNKPDEVFDLFEQTVKDLVSKNKISKRKGENLFTTGDKIGDDFVSRQIKDTQYIAKEVSERLKKVVRKVTSSTGSVTAFLREKWGLNTILHDINLPKYERAGLTQIHEKSGKKKIVEWSKRNDHRHHAIDALVVAFTKQAHIEKLNNLNQYYNRAGINSIWDAKDTIPFDNFVKIAKEKTEDIWVSFKKTGNKVVSKKKNIIKVKGGIKIQDTIVPRGSLHEDTNLGLSKHYEKIKLKDAFQFTERITNIETRNLTIKRIKDFDGNVKMASNSIKKNPLFGNEKDTQEVVILQPFFTKRVPLNDSITPAQIGKIIDPRIKKMVEDFVGDSISKESIKNAFKNYRENPIYQNKKLKIPIWYVKLREAGDLISVRETKEKLPKDYVNTKNNHHAIIFQDEKGNWNDEVVSFWEAVERIRQGYPAFDKISNHQRKVKLILQQNDLFFIPPAGFDISEYNISDDKNRKFISQYLFRVQKFSKKDYLFRHHLETHLGNNFACVRIQSLRYFENIIPIKISALSNLIKR